MDPHNAIILSTSLVNAALHLKIIPFIAIKQDQWHNEHNCQFSGQKTVTQALPGIPIL
jgi:hypothetical protein